MAKRARIISILDSNGFVMVAGMLRRLIICDMCRLDDAAFALLGFTSGTRSRKLLVAIDILVGTDILVGIDILTMTRL